MTKIKGLLCYGCKRRVRKVSSGMDFHCLCDDCIKLGGMKKESVKFNSILLGDQK